MNDSPRQGTPQAGPDHLTRPVSVNPDSPADHPAEGSRPAAPDAGGSATRRLLRALAVMGSGTMVSRLLGLLRVALAAFVIGNGTAQADIYAVAITVPTALYVLFAGGALNSVLVPQLTRAAKHDEDGGEAYTNRITTAFLLILLVVTAVVTLAAPLVTRIYSSDQWRTPEMADHYQSMVLLTMVCLPEVFFYGAFVVLGQILNARDRFGPMMWAPVASNVIQVTSLVIFLGIWGQSDGQDPFNTVQVWVLGGGYLLGAILQASVMVVFLRRIGYRFRPRFDLKGTGLSKTFRLAGWAVGFVLINQVALAVVSRLATSATAGGPGAGLTVYNNAYLVFLLPHSLITVSLATAMVTSASRLAAVGDTAGTAAEVMRTMRLVATALVPAALLLAALGHPIARLLFGNGTGARDAPLIGWTIMAFAVGLIPFTIQHVCLRTYYALERNRDTFLIQLVIATVQIAVSVAFVVPFDRPTMVAPMLALALSLAYVVGLFVSFRHLRKFLPELQGTELARHLVRVTVAIAPGAGIAWFIGSRLDGSQVQTLVALVIGGMVAGGSYLILAQFFRITEITQILGRLRRRKQRTPEPGSGDRAGVLEQDSGVGETDESALMTRVQAAIREPMEAELLPPAGSDAPTRAVPTASPPTELLQPVDPDAPTTAVPTVPGDDEHTGEVFAGDSGDVASDDVASGDVTSGDVDSNDDDYDTEEELHPIRVHPGRLLGGRYKLEEMLIRRTETQSWRATDQVLSRPVVIHLLPPGEDDEQLLTAARRAAVATDSRFLRVLDAQPGDEPPAPPHDPGSEESEPESPVGPYIVCEYAAGVSLERLLAAGPLSALEAAWVVREVADGLAGMHEQGLYHERINPDTVVITATGNVKIVGFLLESELSPRRHHPLIPSSDPERMDIADLGRLLYCTLVSRWPGGHAYGMAAAPVDADGQLLTPRQVRAGVSPALDTICDRILSPVPRQREEPLRSAQDVVRALNQVLGSANAAQDLERRLRYPVPVVTVADEPPLELSDQAGIDTAAGLPIAPLADPTAPTGRLPLISAAEMPTGKLQPVHPATPSEHSVRPRPALPANRLRGDRPPRWISLLVVLVLLVLVGGLIAVALRLAPAGRDGGTANATQHSIVSATDFDPQGATREENPDQVPLAHDADPATAWMTVDYARTGLSGKDGVGVVFDLGEVRDVARAELVLVGSGSSVELRVPAANADTTTQAPPGMDEWATVADAQAASEQVSLVPEEPVRTRFVLVMFTELPRVGAIYRGGIAEAVFWG